MSRAYSTLLLEPDATLAASIAGVAQASGFGVTVVAEARAALDAYVRDTPDLVLLRAAGSGQAAMDFGRALRNRVDGEHAVLVVGVERLELFSSLCEAGIDDCYPLPLEASSLKVRLLAARRRIGERRSRRDADRVGRTPEEALRDVLGHLPDFILTADHESRIVFFSRGGVPGSAGQMLGTTIADHLGPAELAVYQASLATARTTHEVQHYEVTAYERAFTVRLIPIFDDGAFLGATMIATDITERIQAETERERLLSELQVALRETRAALNVRNEFLAVASHELRTPLTTLLMGMQNLEPLVQEGSVIDPPNRRLFDVSLRQVRRLGELVNELVDVTRLQRDQLALQREPADLGRLVADVVARFEPDFLRSGSSVLLNVQPGILGQWDRSRLDQVVSNLLGNAIKFGAGRPIEVSLGMDGTCARLQVRDHGIGIPPASIGKIFEAFERAAPVSHYGGLGLGLYIVRRIVELHGGKARVTSEVGQGTAMIVELPLS